MVTTGGISKRIDRLEAAGLVRRTRPSGGDRRTRLVQLTPEGQELIDRAFEAHMVNEARLVGELSEADRKDLERILRSWLSEHETPED